MERGVNAMARIKQIKREPDDEIEIGDQVKHPKFGTGTVLYRSGSGDRAKATVVFAEEGQKKLLLKYAKLKKIKEATAEEIKAEADLAEAALREEDIVGALDDTIEIPEDDEDVETEEDDFAIEEEEEAEETPENEGL